MEEILLIVALRFVERFAVTGAGILLVYFGYRLFDKVPLAQEGEARISWPKGTSIYLSKVGPGVFFALFGSGILLYSIVSPVEYRKVSRIESSATAAQVKVEERHFVGAGNLKTLASGELQRERNRTRGDLHILNRLEDRLDPGLQGEPRNELLRLVPNLKLCLMERVWDPVSWGSVDDYRAWINSPASFGAPPNQPITSAHAYFQEGIRE